MPITIPDILGIGPGQNFPAVDATNQSVKGFGHFADLAAAQSEAKGYQKITGFLAIITGDTPGVYQYVGADVTTWDNDDFWTLVSAGEPEVTTSETHVDTMSLSVIPFGAFNTNISPYRLDTNAIPSEFEVIPLSNSSSAIYDVFTDTVAATPTVGNNRWSNSWLNSNGPFSGYSDDQALTDISFLGTVKLGYEYLMGGFAGFTTAELTKIQAVNWTTGDTNIVEFLKTIPEGIRPKVYHLFMPSDATVADEVYIGYNPSSGFADTAWEDASNWTLLTEAGTNTISYRMFLSSSSLSISNASTLSIATSYPLSINKSWDNHLTVSAYVADMLKSLKILIKFNASTIDHLVALKGNSNSPFGGSPDDMTFTLKTKVQV